MGRLKPLPYREVKRRLEAAGFVEASQKGSHVKFVRRAGETIDTAIVPKKHEIPVGTLRSIVSQAHQAWSPPAPSDFRTYSVRA